MNAAAIRSNLIGPEVVVRLSEIVGLDPCNSRSLSPLDVEGMAASLREHGQLQALLARRNAAGAYLVLAGGRRWAGFRRLFGDDPARCVVRVRVFNGDDAAAREASLAENVEREGLHALDEAEKFAELAHQRSPEAIARGFGVTRKYVRERIALAALSPRVKAAWREGRFGLASAQAFALARDEAAQEALLASPDFAVLAGRPQEIRRRLAAGEVPASAPAALFVGSEAYLAAGGRILDDLFDEEARFADRALLDRLEREKLAAIAAQLRAEEGWGFALEPGDPAPIERLQDLLPEERAELARIERAFDEALSPVAGEMLHVAREQIERAAALRAVPAAQRHAYGVAVALDAEGRAAIDRAVVRRAVRFDPPLAAAPDVPSSPSPAAGEAAPCVAAAPTSCARATRGAAAPGLAPAARRVAETAASRALAEAIAGSQRLALVACVAAFAVAGVHRRPVRIARDQGPRSVRARALLDLGKLGFAEALDVVAAWTPEALADAFAECVAASVDLRGADADFSRALADFAAGAEPELPARIAEGFDYAAFFREAGRAHALAAIRDCGGEALEMSHAWRDDEALFAQARIIAKAKSWLPEFLRLEGDPS
jgi:ParB family chromosome partitioning protein